MDAAAPDPEEDRCLCHPVGASQVQADASPDQRRKRLVRPAPPRQPNALRPLEVMSWQWLNIGSRVTRDGHARFWERPAVKFLRATRQSRHFRRVPNLSGLIRLSEVRSALRHFGIARIADFRPRFSEPAKAALATCYTSIRASVLF